jgi:hypothetical protein
MALTSITQVLSATSGSGATITFPVGIQAGDLIVLVDYAFNGAAIPSTVTPSGFTIISNVVDALGTRAILSRKLAAGTESGALTCMASTDANQRVMVVFRGNEAAISLTVGSINGQITDGNPTAQNVTASGGVAPLVIIGAYNSSGIISPRTFTVGGVGAKDGEVDISTRGYLAWKIYNSSPSDASIDMDDEGSGQTLQSCYIQMAGTAATNVDGAASSAGAATATAVGQALQLSDGVMDAAGAATASAVGEAVTLADGAMNAAGAATATAVGSSLADAVMSSAGAATAAGVGSALADGVMNAAGAATAAAVGASFAGAAMSAAGVATAVAVGDALLIAEGAMSAIGAATAAAIAVDGGLEVEVPRQPVGGGAGGMMAGGDDRQRFRMRKEKSQPHVIRVGEWPTEAELAALLQDEQREFSQFIAGLSQKEDDEKPVALADQEEDALILLLSAA